MNLKIDVDISPEEVRKLLGLPDVEGFQRQMMEDIRQRMVEGAEGYDPLKLFQPYLSGTVASWELLQKMFSVSSGAGTGREGTKE